MVDEAHGEVKLALQELRDLARGIHPAVLTDRGLDAALSSVASRCTVPVKVDRRPAGAARARPSRASPTSPSPSCSRTSASTAGARAASVDVWRSGRPAADPGPGRRARRRAARRRYGHGGAGRAAGRGGRAVRARLAGRRTDRGHGGTAVARPGSDDLTRAVPSRPVVGKPPAEEGDRLHGPGLGPAGASWWTKRRGGQTDGTHIVDAISTGIADRQTDGTDDHGDGVRLRGDADRHAAALPSAGAARAVRGRGPARVRLSAAEPADRHRAVRLVGHDGVA